MMTAFRSIWDNPRVRGEIGWVVVHKLTEFLVLFVALKLFTNLMGKEVYGEYNLVLSGVVLLVYLIIMPMQQAYLRYHHTAEENGLVHTAGRVLIRWFAVATVALVAVTALLSRPLCGGLKFETWSLLAGGLVFLGYAWRGFGIELLDLRRKRRANMLQNVGFFATQTAFVTAALLIWPVSAVNALLASALAQIVFGLISARPFVRNVLKESGDAESDMMGMVLRFGIPYGALLACQWVQGFSERYMLGIKLDFESVGLYVAAYRVCGVPYMLMLGIVRALLTPIAYQRAKDVNDPRQLWSADKVLLLGMAIYLALGALAAIVYVAAGPRLLRLLTSAEFILPAGTMLCLALARYMQCLGILTGTFFAVHHKMGTPLWFRAAGALVTLPICYFAIDRYGLAGAAGGILAAGLLYNGLVCLGPGGYLWLLRDTRLRALKHDG